MGRGAYERGAGDGTAAAARRGLVVLASRPPAVAVLVVALLVAATVVASVAGTLALTQGTGSGAVPGGLASPPLASTPTAAPTDPRTTPPTEAPTAAAPQPPGDPGDAFRDPELRTLATPFLAGSAVTCRPAEPGADAVESVSCELGGDRTAVFTRLADPDVMRERRRDIVAGEGAETGTVLSVRWRYAPGEPDAHAGIPPAQRDRGEGVRVRYVDTAGLPRLYFDQDSSGCTGEIALTRPTGNDRADLEELREFWSDPA